MSSKTIVSTDQRQTVTLVLPDSGKDVKHRLERFESWLAAHQRTWDKPDLATYRDYLLEQGLSPASVNSHLSTIRGRYSDLLDSEAGRDYFYSQVPEGTSPADAKSFVDEMTMRVNIKLNPKQTSAKVVTVQDQADSEVGIRLTVGQANTLLASPDTSTKLGLRDLAVLAIGLCTGLREQEMADLDVSDLRQSLNGNLAIRVRQGKGKKQRLVPYGELSWCLAIVDRWLTLTGITEGAVFRGFWKAVRFARQPSAPVPLKTP